MKQHTGEPALPVVNKGDTVNEGELIGKARGRDSANVHAAVPGKVIDIINDHNGAVVVIEAEGAFTRTGSSSAINDWKNTDRKRLLEIVREAGIVELEGDPYPVYLKLDPAAGKKIDTLIVNGSESEPYITVDDMLMRTYPREIVEGIQIALKIAGLKKAVIGIDDNKKKAIISLRDAVRDLPGEEEIVIKPLQSKYPQGAEKQLVYSSVKRVVPAGGVPEDAAVIVMNIGTVYALREAVLFNKPLIDRYITVSGEMVNRPGNFKVRIGTKISDIVEECGGLKGASARIVIGGPMRGVAVDSADIPVLKSTSGILFLSEDDVVPEEIDPCIRCGRCISVCPVLLVPCDIAQAAEKEKYGSINKLHAQSCILCSCCSYICPSKRPLSYLIKKAQEALKQ
jgi:electron transport complex protein RnfC